MICNKCGANVNPDEKFCASCGADLTALDENIPENDAAVLTDETENKPVSDPAAEAEPAMTTEPDAEAAAIPATETAPVFATPEPKPKKRHPVLISVLCTVLAMLLICGGLIFGAYAYLQSGTQVALKCFNSVNVDYDYQEYMSCFAPSSREAIQQVYYDYYGISTPEEMQAFFDEGKSSESAPALNNIEAKLNSVYFADGIRAKLTENQTHLIEDTDLEIENVKAMCDVRISFVYGEGEEAQNQSTIYSIVLVEGAWYVLY